MELEEPSFDFVPSKDDRPLVPVPPPVTIVAVADVTLPCVSGQGRVLADFYVSLFGFEPVPDADRPVFRAENVKLLFQPSEGPIEREDFRPLRLQVRDLERVRQGLIDRKTEFLSTHRLHTSDEMILVTDPAGNYLEVVEFRPIF